jgi:hypothetical protein
MTDDNRKILMVCEAIEFDFVLKEELGREMSQELDIEWETVRDLKNLFSY